MVKVPLSGSTAPARPDLLQPELAEHIDRSLREWKPSTAENPAELPDLFGPLSPQATRSLQALASTADSAAVVISPQAELTNPLTGEVVNEQSIDELIDCYEYIDRKDKAIFAVKQRIKTLLLARTEGDAVTRRIAGAKRVAKLTLPAEGFDQATLKRLWAEYPELAAQYLRIESIAVQAREVAKLRNTSSDQADLVAFRDALIAASKGRGLPTISIEE